MLGSNAGEKRGTHAVDLHRTLHLRLHAGPSEMEVRRHRQEASCEKNGVGSVEDMFTQELSQ